MHRKEVNGTVAEDMPPPLPGDRDLTEVQRPEDGVGPLFHRLYRTRITGSQLSPDELLKRVAGDPDCVVPSEFATFQKVRGEEGTMRVGDEYVVRMAGPWDGPVRVVVHEPAMFRLVTLAGHLEAGQIEFRARKRADLLVFEIESWARSSNRLTDLLYDRLRMSKEVQLHMWTSTLEQIAELAAGRTTGGIDIRTRRVDGAALGR
jgi:hypothetical protein